MNNETPKPLDSLTPFDAFKRNLPDAKCALSISDDGQSLLYSIHEELVYALIVSQIFNAADRGECSCRVDLDRSMFSGLTASTVLDEVKSTLEEAGYRIARNHLYSFIIFWDDKKRMEEELCEPF